ncbi:MAG: LamG domain-containing protein [Nitrosopumilus sp.]|nr:LamG domain-containing protein [Nitrosopumilus sp.]MDH3385665.1 LamG domain-containing protein [Nitrosopumilus sp.]
MKQRRALSTVVGGVFFLIVIITAASYLTSSMNLFEDFSENVIAAEQERENRKKESFEISRLTIANNKINLDVYNSGDIPISFSRLWVQNVTGVDQVYRFDLNQTVAPGNMVENILQFLPFTALPTESYKMKLVTDRGFTKEFSVNASTDPLHLQLFALPEEVPTNFKTTILLSVTNNSTQNTIYTNIQPILQIVPLGATADLVGTMPDPHPVLEKGNSAIFEWTYKISGDDGDKIQFNASILNGVPENTISKEVSVKVVEFAEESGSSLESRFLTSSSAPDNVLFFHKETFDALGQHQMWASIPEDNIGEIIDFSVTSPNFYTNTDGNVTVNIPDGKWNATLRYISSSMPESLRHTGSTAEDMAYHFESDLNSPLDTTTNTIMTLASGSQRPIWIPTGHQGAGAYEFSGNQYALIGITDNNDLDNSPTTTAGWFKAYSTGPNDYQTIFYGENSTGNDDYEIYLNPSGYLVFRLDASFTSLIATCTSPTDYRDDTWHHFVAVMPSDNDCKLYVDGILQDSDFNSGTGTIILSGDIQIGANTISPVTNGFHGMLDDIIHWDNYDLNENGEQEVEDLYNTNYGTSAHLMDFNINIVDEFGNDLGLPEKIINQTLSFPIKYSSDFAEYSSPTSDIWGQINFTAITTEQRVIEPGERLKLQMTNVPKSIGNLDMKMVIDNTSVVSGLGSSFLQIPFPDKGLPGYGGYDNSDIGVIGIFNPGPTDNWIKYQSRVVFEDENTGASYAAFIITSDGTPLGPNQDSSAILAGDTISVEFDRPRAQPGNVSSELIPEGRYRMYVFLDGYNSEGNVFLQTNYIGVVRVI